MQKISQLERKSSPWITFKQIPQQGSHTTLDTTYRSIEHSNIVLCNIENQEAPQKNTAKQLYIWMVADTFTNSNVGTKSNELRANELAINVNTYDFNNRT